jgi:GNAT superfamily N-acetyltransferase
MEIRKAKVNDLPTIAGMAMEFMKYHAALDPYLAPARGARKLYFEFFRRAVFSGRSLLLVAVAGEKIVGYALAEITEKEATKKNYRYGLICDVYFEKKHRRLGGMKFFLKEIFGWFREKKIRNVELYVLLKNDIGRKAWGKYGFQEYFLKLKKRI